MGTTLQIARGSLTDGAERVLVNASNTELRLGTGVSGAIRAACGPGFQERLYALRAQRGGSLAPGEVVVTDAGAHPTARHIAHVAVMDYRPGTTGPAHPTLDLIRTACERLWDALEGLSDEPELSVAMVALGAGTGGLGLVDTTKVSCETLKAHLAIHANTRISRVVFYGYALHEYLATAGEVVRHFPEVAQGLPEDVRQHLASVAGR